MIMKNYFVMLCLIFCSVTLSAQVATEKTHSISANIIGLEYNYELPLGKTTTMVFHGGVAGELAYSNSSLFVFDEKLVTKDAWHASLRGTVGADFRYYYNFEKRARKGKSLKDNSGNFLSLDLQYYTPGFYTRNMDTKSVTLLTPSWGLKRVYNSNLLIELNFGFSVGFDGSYFGWKPAANFKFGYSF